MSIKFKPSLGRVLVKRNEAETVTKNGIFIPDDAKEKPMEGTVVISNAEDTVYKPKDVILFGKYSGVEVKIDDVLYLLLNEDDILGTRL